MKKTATFCFFGAMLTIAFISSSDESCACTGFVAHDAGIVLVGNNEDWGEPYSMIWFLPQEKGKYGRVYFGFDGGGFAFGGMNDQGLFFDLYSLPRKPVQTSEHRKFGKMDLILTIMETCATVEEALQVLREYNLKFLERMQIMLADKTGDAIIIEETDVIHRKQSRYQVVTNFRLSEVQQQDITCWRLKKLVLYCKKNLFHLNPSETFLTQSIGKEHNIQIFMILKMVSSMCTTFMIINIRLYSTFMKN